MIEMHVHLHLHYFQENARESTHLVGLAKLCLLSFQLILNPRVIYMYAKHVHTMYRESQGMTGLITDMHDIE